MKNCLVCALISVVVVPAQAQQEPGASNVPDSVRAMIEQSQGGRYEQMARLQVDSQYGDFLNQLSGGTDKRNRVEDAMVAVISERAELSAQAVTGQVSPAQLEAISSYAYFRGQLRPLLNSNELELLDVQQGAMAEVQLRRNYREQMLAVAPDISEQNQQRVLDTLISHMLFQDDSDISQGRMSAEQLVNQQLMSLRQAREEMQSRFASEQLQQVNLFLDTLRSNLFLSTSMDEGAGQ